MAVNPKPKGNSPKGQTDAKAAQIIKRDMALKQDIASWETEWQEIADLMMPRKAGITTTTLTPNDTRESQLFDTSASDASMTMAGGLMSWVMPANEPWFSYDPIFQLRDRDSVKLWLLECSQRIQEMLATSNFYTEAHEDLLNHCVFGTSALFSGFENGNFYFESLPVGTFRIAENAFGQVDTLYRDMELTAVQAREMFGEENLPKCVLDALGQPSSETRLFKFIHAIYPRPQSERGKTVIEQSLATGKAWASCYVECSEKKLVKESGYDTFPVSVGRFLKWTGLGKKSAYGYGPGFAALPDVRQINFLQMMLDVSAEKLVRPPMMAPGEMEGDLILSAGGITYFDNTIGADRWPKPIPVVGDFNVSLQRVQERREAINKKFHVELFNMFASMEDRQRTAFEIAERSSEKIVLINPAFSRLTNEKVTPLLQRLFVLAYENGMLPPPPPEAIVQADADSRTGVIPDPAVTYTSRLALAIKQLSNLQFERQMQGMVALASVQPDVMDNLNLDRITRDTANNNNVRSGWIRPFDEVQALRQQRAQAQQAAMQAQMAVQASQAVRNVGGPEKALQMMQGM